LFFPGSRYENQAQYQVRQPDGSTVAVIRLPLPLQNPVMGYHKRHQGQRLDLIASLYLADATAFWLLCDANNAVAPDALAAHDLIGIPVKGR
jgi:hypothetical protein